MFWKRIGSNVLTRIILWLFFGAVGVFTSRRERKRRERERAKQEDQAIAELEHGGRFDA